jgi:hypothetical protein
VGSDEDALATRRALPKVTASASRCMWQTTGKMSTSRAVATIATYQTAQAKKKKHKRTKPVVSVDMTTVSFGVETINVDDGG